MSIREPLLLRWTQWACGSCPCPWEGFHLNRPTASALISVIPVKTPTWVAEACFTAMQLGQGPQLCNTKFCKSQKRLANSTQRRAQATFSESALLQASIKVPFRCAASSKVTYCGPQPHGRSYCTLGSTLSALCTLSGRAPCSPFGQRTTGCRAGSASKAILTFTPIRSTVTNSPSAYIHGKLWRGTTFNDLRRRNHRNSATNVQNIQQIRLQHVRASTSDQPVPSDSRMEEEGEKEHKDPASQQKQLTEMPGSYSQFGTAALLLYGLNQGLSKLTTTLGIQFPSALIGMFSIIMMLGILEKASPPKAEAVVRWFDPAILWIQRWLGAFYVPSLAVLPLTINGIAGTSLAKMVAVVAVGMPLTLLTTAQVAFTVRNYVQTEMQSIPAADSLPPFDKMHFITWGVVGVVSVALAMFNPGWAIYMSFPCLLAATLEGTLLGSLLPASLNKILHPIIVTCLSVNAGAALYGAATGMGYHSALQSYMTKGAGLMGAGDFLMSFLGVIILSFAFKIFDQRHLMVRHAPEILGSCAVSAAVSMLGTAALCRVAGLDPDFTLGLVPRSITMALALPIASQLHASAGITALGVMLTGLLGANFAQILLNAAGFDDPIARGLSTSSAAHGLGTAAMAASEPEALPFCALAYALIGIMSTLVIAVPGFTNILMFIAGH